ncbi:MAG: DUF4115 domain-containing protein [Ramlibacter sp.]|nr:DUF4115 domain-containing protein [Ramlibacter sp.]
MSEAVGPPPASGFDNAAAGDDLSAGTMLRQAREASGLHVSTLAVALKVPSRKLEALEADRHDELSDAVFVRALAASVCRNLKIDPAPVLQRLPASRGPQLARTEGGINEPFRSPRDGAGPSWLDQLSRPVFLAVVALLLGALVLIVLPRQEEAAAVPDPTLVPAPAPAQFGVSGVESTVPPAVGAPVTAVPWRPASTLTPAPMSPAAVTRSLGPSVMSTGSATAVPGAAVAAASERPAGIVVFTARGQSWVQVVDAKGAVALRKLMAAGESAGASGALPLTVTVGSASTTDVVVRGQRLELAPLARDNVARFEVK